MRNGTFHGAVLFWPFVRDNLRLSTENTMKITQTLSLAFLLGICLGCPAAEPDSLTLQKIKASGVIAIGYREGSVPFSYLDSHHQPVGFSMDICNRVVLAIRERLKLKSLNVRLVPMTPATRIPLVASGTIDLECGVTTNTPERQKSVAFSVTTFVTESRLVSRRDMPIDRIDDLRGKKVITTIGTTSMHYLNDLNRTRKLGMEIMAGRDDADSFLMVVAGRAQAYAMDEVLLRSFIANAPNPQDYLISREALSVEPYGIMLNKTDPVFKQAVDAAIVALFRSGEFGQIYRHWFETPIPGQGINLQLPMSDALKAVIARPTDSPDPGDYLRTP